MPRRRSLRYERRIFLLALLAGLPGVVVGLVLLWHSAADAKTRWTVALLVVAVWWGAALALRERVVRPLQTLSNLLGALREGDFSIRARGARADDALGLAYLEVNALSEMLRQQRVRALEATALLRAVMEEIDVAVLAFDESGALRLANRAAERLLGEPAPRLLGRTAEGLGLGGCLVGPAPRTLDAAFPGGTGRWELRRSRFRQGGLPHQLVVLADVSRALREEERQAWQRLVRVLGHEINNSLAPIQSIAGSLQDVLRREPLEEDARDDLRQGLAVVQARAGALGRFMSAYSRLARLPTPRRGEVEVGEWVRRVAALEPRLHVTVLAGPETVLAADGDQLEQLLINLVRNATDAALETGGGVEVGWERRNGELLVRVEDEGPGLASTANLFVPFFTTKPGGSGIGLALSRQIAEAHGGTLTLANREGARGCVARLVLPAPEDDVTR
ncbi:MAG TPA: ATP-binding protein [Longimicrobiaceae bacterium]|nr:ATP-binding protein [Longimicrobiaceae bacterium]